MLVIVTNDQQTIDGGNVLRKMYPKEASALFNSFMIKLGKVRREKDGSLPTRITLLSHGTETRIGEYSSQEFVDKLIEQFTEAAKIEPDIKKSLHTIDILACNVGLLKPKGQKGDVDCLALTVAQGLQKLQKLGFNPIKVNAFSNTALENPDVYAIYTRMNYDKNAIEACIMPDKKSFDEYAKIVALRFDKKDQLDEIIEKRDELKQEIKVQKNKTKKAPIKIDNQLDNQIKNQQKHIEALKPSIINVATQIADIWDKNKAQKKLSTKDFSPVDQANLKKLRESQNKMIEEITLAEKEYYKLTKLKIKSKKPLKELKRNKAKKSLKELKQNYADLNIKIETLQKTIAAYKKKEDAFLQIIASTTDVRKTLDNNPSYHFHTLAKELERIKANIVRFFKQPEPKTAPVSQSGTTPRPGRR